MLDSDQKKDITSQERFFKKGKIILWLMVGLIINLVTWVYLFIEIKPQATPIFLHYNIYFGVDLIGSWYRIYLMPLAGLLIYFINLYLSYIIYKRERTISYIIIGLTIFLELNILLASFLIVRQNI